MIQNIHQNQQKWFTDHKIKVLPWPSQFPDWNPIEKLLGELKRRVHQHGPQNGKDLKRFCIEEWPQIPYPCILQTHQSEKIQCCYLGKGRQHKVLTKRVPVIVAHKFIKDICFLIKLCCVCNCLYSVRESFLLIFCTKDQKVKQ